MSDEYLALLELDPLYLAAQSYLYEHELGLAPAKEELPAKLIAAIKFVHAESQNQREQRRERTRKMKEMLNSG
jgi:hypothetical protein|tara:strand:- start:1635 stop:1853 length:219 start_codon:yes stop_codon:yes gene_type:complete